MLDCLWECWCESSYVCVWVCEQRKQVYVCMRVCTVCSGKWNAGNKRVRVKSTSINTWPMGICINTYMYMCVHISYSTQWKVKLHIFVAANHKTLIYANLALLRLWLCARLNIFVSLTRTAKANDRATLKAQLRDVAYVYIKTFLFVCVCACLFLCVCMWDCEAELKSKVQRVNFHFTYL